MEGFRNENIERLRLDVTNDANVEEVVKTVIEKEGRVDILVNNAGVPSSGPLAEEPSERVLATFDVNVFAILRMARAVFPHMAARKSGTIVNIGSIVGETPTPWGGLYDATKASVRSISESLHMECAPFHIRVTHVAAGGVHTNIARNGLDSFSLPEGSLYAGWLDSIIRHTSMNETSLSLTAEKFAQRLVHRTLTRRPPRYVSLGAGSLLFAMFKWLPRGLVLWILWKFSAGTPSA